MLSKILSNENIQLALDHLEKKKDVCGSDGIMLLQLNEYWKLNKDNIIDSLTNGTYVPGIIQQVEILNKTGKKRIISKLTSIDRLLLRAILQVLSEQISDTFSPNSFAYRKNLSTFDAVKRIKNFIENGATYVVEIDIKDFFDNINHDILIETIKKSKVDIITCNIINKFLKCRIEHDYIITTRDIGIIQGSPLSPFLSNLYMDTFDKYMDNHKFQYVRFSDDIKIFVNSYEEGTKAYLKASNFLSSNLKLQLSKNKSGIFKVENRAYFGYELINSKDKIYIRKKTRTQRRVLNYWSSTILKKMNANYHIISDGILSKKDFSLLFENDGKKMYIPIETTDSLNIHSRIILSSDFFKFINYKKLIVSFFDEHNKYIGGFYPAEQRRTAKYTINQAVIYSNDAKRLYIAKKIIMAATHNIRANIRYYSLRKNSKILIEMNKKFSVIIKNMNEAKKIDELMLIEARMREDYYKCYNEIISVDGFMFFRRTKRPPKDPLNSLISFGNTILYNKIATEINKTALDIRISFLHSANRRNESLNLDISEIFKPIIIDRIIFALINKHIIDEKVHFHVNSNDGVYLNDIGKYLFLRSFYNKMEQKITINNQIKTYQSLISEEIKKLAAFILNGVNYTPYKYQ